MKLGRKISQKIAGRDISLISLTLRIAALLTLTLVHASPSATVFENVSTNSSRILATLSERIVDSTFEIGHEHKESSTEIVWKWTGFVARKRIQHQQMRTTAPHALIATESTRLHFSIPMGWRSQNCWRCLQG